MDKMNTGDRVRYHGETTPNLAFDEHFTVRRLFPSGTCYDPQTFAHVPYSDTANRVIGDWALVDDGDGRLYLLPQSHLSPVDGRCICDGCTAGT